MQTIHGSGKLYSADRYLVDVTYTIHDSSGPLRFGRLSGAFRIVGEEPHPLMRPRADMPALVIHLEDGRTLRITILEEGRRYTDDSFHFQGEGGFDK